MHVKWAAWSRPHMCVWSLTFLPVIAVIKLLYPALPSVCVSVRDSEAVWYQCKVAKEEIKELLSLHVLTPTSNTQNTGEKDCLLTVISWCMCVHAPVCKYFPWVPKSVCSCMLIPAVLRNLICVKVSSSLRSLAVLLIMQHGKCARWWTDYRSRSVHAINGIAMGSELLPIKSPLNIILQR